MRRLTMAWQMAVFWTLLFSARAALAAAPEMWVVQIGKNIPGSTPAGRSTNSSCFVVRILGSDDKIKNIDLFNAMRFRVRDRSGKTIPFVFVQNGERFIMESDIVDFDQTRPGQKCYLIHLDEYGLRIPTGTGGNYIYNGIPKGKYYIDITVDTTDNAVSPMVSRFESKYTDPEHDPFFRGVMKCGTLTLNIGKALNGRRREP